MAITMSAGILIVMLKSLNRPILNRTCALFWTHISTAIMVFILIISTSPGSVLLAAEQPSVAGESNLKSAYIFNFIRFTDWPEAAQQEGEDRLLLNVLGEHDILDVLKTISKKQIGQKMGLEVQACATIACIRESSVLFISKSLTDDLRDLLKPVAGIPILTISDIPDFARLGGMIEIRKMDNKLTFIINLGAVRKANLYLSAQLLQLAEVIGEKP